MLEFLGKLGKGFGTVAGIGTIVLGALGHTQAASDLTGIGNAGANIIIGLGGLLTSFGVGRKAGVAAAPTLTHKR